MTIETTIRNGLPVRARGDVFNPELDVGIMSQFVDEITITFLSGDEFTGELSDEDEQRIVERACGGLQR